VLALTVALFDRKALIYLAIPALLIGGGINYPSLRRAHRDDFYIGYPDLKTAAGSFAFTSLHAIPDHDGILGGDRTARNIGWLGLPVFTMLAGALTLRLVRLQQLPFLTFAITMAGLIIARRLFGVNYPADRTALYFVLLVPLAWALAGDALNSRALRTLWLLPLVVVTIQFATQLQTRHFQFWRGQVDDEIIARLIQKDSTGKPDASLRVSSTWVHQPTLEFYRRIWGMRAIQEIRRLEPTPLTGFDFYVASGSDYERAKKAGRVVLDDPDIEVLLAEP
jgi:hypothetical protein